MAYKKRNIFFSTTIAAVIGTLVYLLVAYIIYPTSFSALNVLIFFVIIWMVYYLIAKTKYKQHYK